MDKQSHPQTLGVFAPVGHVIVSFPTQQDMGAAADALREAGFADENISRYTSDQMREQVDIDLAKASPLANLGQEINLARAHGELADEGYSFLVVKAKEEAQWTQVAEIARRFHAERAQRYGNFIIEELIEPSGEEQQTFESPARGLDAQTVSGKEEDRRR
ncbi:hypothetical protein [Piscinibacter sp. HJYY11]|uniref:hypothetical protein n=1 Tax=Piscinibacter sp. HJYY11 TaxID=2801333 RepID=UPI00191E90CB|nr:hypothetical protein [Piscinibacter sp. HJYY11]MBL0729068.1 hypothetical protein [Piscinibacter sp. HJYY11]